MEEKVKPDLFEEFPVVCSGLVRVWEARTTVRPEIKDIEKIVAFCSKELWLFPADITLSLKVVRRAVEAWSRTPVCGLRCGGKKVFTKSRSYKPKGLLIWWQGIWRGVDGSVWELGCRLDRENPEKWLGRRSGKGRNPGDTLDSVEWSPWVHSVAKMEGGCLHLDVLGSSGHGHSTLNEQIWSSGCGILESGHASWWHSNHPGESWEGSE